MYLHEELTKRICNMKCGLRAQFEMLIWPVLAKQPINVYFCDILVL